MASSASKESPVSPAAGNYTPTPTPTRTSTPIPGHSPASTLPDHAARFVFDPDTHHARLAHETQQADAPKLTLSALRAHDKRGERHSIRQAVRHGQRPGPSKPPKAIPRLEGPFRDAAAETIYGLESALSVMVAEHGRLEGAAAALRAQVAELQARNHVLAQTASRERAARAHAESRAEARKRAMQAEVDFLRRSLSSTGNKDKRTHRTVAAKEEGEESARGRGRRRQIMPPWHPGNGDDGVDHGDLYSDVLDAFVTQGAMPNMNWVLG